MADKPMTRAEHIERFMTPTGRQFHIVSWEGNPSLMEIRYADGGKGELPVKFQNHRFTKRPLAVEYLVKILNDMWDDAESRTKAKVA